MKFIILDTETTDGTKKGQPAFVYDIAARLVDYKGDLISERAWLLPDILDRYLPFYAGKMGYYVRALSDGRYHAGAIEQVFNQLNSFIESAGADTVLCAYNAEFDTRMLGATSKYWLQRPAITLANPPSLMCLWRAFCEATPENYFAGWTEKGNVATGAEAAYRWLTKNMAFDEAHVALEDIQIENEILKFVLNSGINLPIVLDPHQLIEGAPWYIVKNKSRLGFMSDKEFFLGRPKPDDKPADSPAERDDG